LASLGWQLSGTGQGVLAKDVLGLAVKKATDDRDSMTLSDAYRFRAQLYSTAGALGLDLDKLRHDYLYALKPVLGIPNPSAARTAATLLVSEWSQFELSSGLHSCGQELAEWALAEWKKRSRLGDAARSAASVCRRFRWNDFREQFVMPQEYSAMEARELALGRKVTG
jgi:hypothetical protein